MESILKPADFYTKEFACGENTITRGYLENLPCSFCTQEVTDEQMQRIVDEAEAESLSRITHDMDEDYIEDIRFQQLESALVRHNVPYYEDIVTAYHGTPNPNVQFSTDGNRVIYFTDGRNIAGAFARAEGRGGLLRGESPTLIQARIVIRNPLIIHTDEEWMQVADSTTIDKQALIAQGYNSIVCSNETGVFYYVVFDKSDCQIIQKETIKP